MKLLRAALAGCILLPAAGWAADYVGSNVCKTCHPDVWSNFPKNSHFKSVASGKESPENTGCESCHGPGSAHVEARGGKGTIVSFSDLGPEKTLDACLRCHGETMSRANIRRSSHTQQDVVCTNCHSIHHSPAPKFLLAKNQTELCYECHASVRAEFSMPFKHRVNEGVIQCTDCHNPHGAWDPTWRMASRPRMIDQTQVSDEPCVKCHADKRGPFVFEHGAGSVEGCESCHQPHGSMNARLLRRPTVFTLCLECHNGQGNFGGFGPAFHAGIAMPAANHNLANPRYQNCTTCHVKIHGSNTSDFFLR
ncbi:MAG: DmsE family decaheme c-type cytochrome [Bryobacteraceae bacterium]